MADARGFSNFYPLLPIMNVISMVLCLLLIPGFWKARIVALVTLVVWIFLANLVGFIGMIQWRGNTNDVPILAGIFAVFWRIWSIGCFAATACFAHFTWQRLQPLPMRELYDTRRRNNLIHFVVSIMVPVLWAPLILVSCPYRYVIIEDIGPAPSFRYDWPGYLTNRLPQILSHLASILFNTLALVTYWRMKREDIESDLLKHQSSARTRKLLLLALSHTLLAAYGVFRSVQVWATVDLVAPSSFAENIASLQHVFQRTRSIVEDESNEGFIARVASRFTIPLLGFYLFAWFGCGKEARKAYREACMKPVRLMGLSVEEHQPHVGSSPSPWSCIALQRPKLPQGSANSLPLTRPNAPQITPYTSAAPRDNSSEPSATPANNSPSIPVRNGIDIWRQGKTPSREPARRLSMHKPPLALLNPANATSSASDIPLRRLSCHKPPFVPLVPPNVPAITGPDASGSVAPRVKSMDNGRRQEKFAPRSPPQRISYHKPTFVPLAPGAIANGLGRTIPPAKASRGLTSDRDPKLQAGSALDSGMVPPPFSSSSTSMAPPSFLARLASMSPPPAFLSPSTSTAPPALRAVSTSTALTPLSTTSTRAPAPPYQTFKSLP